MSRSPVSAESPDESAFAVRRLADVARRSLDWLWFGRIPLGKLTLLAGEPGVGKSLLAADFAARVTRGINFPDDRHPVPPGTVIYFAAEHELADTLLPRLEAAGADLSRVLAITASGGRQPPEGLNCPLTKQPGINDDRESHSPRNVEPQTSHIKRRAPNDECRRSNVESNLNDGCPNDEAAPLPVSTFESRHSDFFRHSEFDMRISAVQGADAPRSPALCDVQSSMFEVRRSGGTLPEIDPNTSDTGDPFVPHAPAETGALQGADAPRSPSLVTDLGRLDALLAATPDARLVIIDPLLAYFEGANVCHPQVARRIVRELADLAGRRRVAIVAVTSVTPRGPPRALARIAGGLPFVEAAQSVWLLAPDAVHPPRRLLVPAKTSRMPTGCALALDFAEERTVWEPDRLVLSADEALSRSSRVRLFPREDEDTRDWLGRVLFDKPLPAAEVLALARKNGFTPAMLRHAREHLGVEVRRDGFGPGSRFLWSLEHLRENVVAEAASFGTCDSPQGSPYAATTTPSDPGGMPTERGEAYATSSPRTAHFPVHPSRRGEWPTNARSVNDAARCPAPAEAGSFGHGGAASAPDDDLAREIVAVAASFGNENPPPGSKPGSSSRLTRSKNRTKTSKKRIDAPGAHGVPPKQKRKPRKLSPEGEMTTWLRDRGVPPRPP